jgi:uncharacterized protein YndB with AHSA1/START domain
MNQAGTLQITTPTDREIVMSRVFNAPRSLVFEAMADPELLPQWLSGPPGWSMIECENDLKVGGSFRYLWRGPDGAEMTMRGVYHEVVPPQRVVRTESIELGDTLLGEQLATATYSENEGKTTFSVTLRYASKEDRDATIASGMERGVATSYDAFEKLLVSAQAR